MKRPLVPGAPKEAEPPPGGRALSRARQFAQARGLPAPTVLAKALPEANPEPALATRKKKVPKAPAKPRPSVKRH